jgi:hypothetical protein
LWEAGHEGAFVAVTHDHLEASALHPQPGTRGSRRNAAKGALLDQPSGPSPSRDLFRWFAFMHFTSLDCLGVIYFVALPSCDLFRYIIFM